MVGGYVAVAVYRVKDMKNIKRTDHKIITRNRTVIDIYKKIILKSCSNLCFMDEDLGVHAKLRLRKDAIEAQALEAKIEKVKYCDLSNKVFPFIRLNIYGDRCDILEANGEIRIEGDQQLFYPFPAIDIIPSANTVRLNLYSAPMLWIQHRFRDYAGFIEDINDYITMNNKIFFFVYTNVKGYFRRLYYV